MSPLVVHGPLQINKRVINLNLSVIWNVPAAWWAEVQNVYFFFHCHIQIRVYVAC